MPLGVLRLCCVRTAFPVYRGMAETCRVKGGCAYLTALWFVNIVEGNMF